MAIHGAIEHDRQPTKQIGPEVVAEPEVIRGVAEGPLELRADREGVVRGVVSVTQDQGADRELRSA